MNLTFTKEIIDNIVLIKDETVWGAIAREDFAAFLFFVNNKTTGDVVVTNPQYNVETSNEWAYENLADGVYTLSAIYIPLFSYVKFLEPVSIKKGTVVYDNSVGKPYRALNTVLPIEDVYSNPSDNPTDWIELTATNLYSIYDPTFIPTPDSPEVFHMGFVKVIYYNNLINTYTKLAKEFANTAKCGGGYLERLRKLRDKYEAVELAAAASNYLGVQIIIEASDNLLCDTSC